MIAVRTRFHPLVDTDEALAGRCGRQSRRHSAQRLAVALPAMLGWPQSMQTKLNSRIMGATVR